MGRCSLTYVQREMAIIDFLNKHGIAHIYQLCEFLDASPATIRRDFTQMELKNLVIRSRGCVQLASNIDQSPVSQSIMISGYVDEEKVKLAELASTFVEKGDSIFVGAGKTCNLLASFIKDIDHLTVVTTNITVVLQLVSCANISLVLLGGDVRAGANFIETISLASDVEKEIGSFYFDKVFITVDGIKLDSGYTIKNRLQIPLYHRLLDASKDFYVLADSDKFDRQAFVPVFNIEQINNVITTSDASSAYINYYKNNNKNIYLA